MRTVVHIRANLELIKKTQMLGQFEPYHLVQYAKFPLGRLSDARDLLPQVQVPANIYTQATAYPVVEVKCSEKWGGAETFWWRRHTCVFLAVDSSSSDGSSHSTKVNYHHPIVKCGSEPGRAQRQPPVVFPQGCQLGCRESKISSMDCAVVGIALYVAKG